MKIECLWSFSSRSKSLKLLPSATFPLRVTALASNSIASEREVLPQAWWPTSRTLRMSAVV